MLGSNLVGGVGHMPANLHMIAAGTCSKSLGEAVYRACLAAHQVVGWSVGCLRRARRCVCSMWMDTIAGVSLQMLQHASLMAWRPMRGQPIPLLPCRHWQERRQMRLPMLPAARVAGSAAWLTCAGCRKRSPGSICWPGRRARLPVLCWLQRPSQAPSVRQSRLQRLSSR